METAGATAVTPITIEPDPSYQSGSEDSLGLEGPDKDGNSETDTASEANSSLTAPPGSSEIQKQLYKVVQVNINGVVKNLLVPIEQASAKTQISASSGLSNIRSIVPPTVSNTTGANRFPIMVAPSTPTPGVRPGGPVSMVQRSMVIGNILGNQTMLNVNANKTTKNQVMYAPMSSLPSDARFLQTASKLGDKCQKNTLLIQNPSGKEQNSLPQIDFATLTKALQQSNKSNTHVMNMSSSGNRTILMNNSLRPTTPNNKMTYQLIQLPNQAGTILVQQPVSTTSGQSVLIGQKPSTVQSVLGLAGPRASASHLLSLANNRVGTPKETQSQIRIVPSLVPTYTTGPKNVSAGNIMRTVLGAPHTQLSTATNTVASSSSSLSSSPEQTPNQNGEGSQYDDWICEDTTETDNFLYEEFSILDNSLEAAAASDSAISSTDDEEEQDEAEKSATTKQTRTRAKKQSKKGKKQGKSSTKSSANDSVTDASKTAGEKELPCLERFDSEDSQESSVAPARKSSAASKNSSSESGGEPPMLQRFDSPITKGGSGSSADEFTVLAEWEKEPDDMSEPRDKSDSNKDSSSIDDIDIDVTSLGDGTEGSQVTTMFPNLATEPTNSELGDSSSAADLEKDTFEFWKACFPDLKQCKVRLLNLDMKNVTQVHMDDVHIVIGRSRPQKGRSKRLTKRLKHGKVSPQRPKRRIKRKIHDGFIPNDIVFERIKREPKTEVKSEVKPETKNEPVKPDPSVTPKTKKSKQKKSETVSETTAVPTNTTSSTVTSSSPATVGTPTSTTVASTSASTSTVTSVTMATKPSTHVSTAEAVISQSKAKYLLIKTNAGSFLVPTDKSSLAVNGPAGVHTIPRIVTSTAQRPQLSRTVSPQVGAQAPLSLAMPRSGQQSAVVPVSPGGRMFMNLSTVKKEQVDAVVDAVFSGAKQPETKRRKVLDNTPIELSDDEGSLGEPKRKMPTPTPPVGVISINTNQKSQGADTALPVKESASERIKRLREMLKKQEEALSNVKVNKDKIKELCDDDA